MLVQNDDTDDTELLSQILNCLTVVVKALSRLFN